MVSDFANNLTSDMAAHISSLFTEVEDPISIQESAFYKFLIKRGYNTCSLRDTGLRIYRGKEKGYRSQIWLSCEPKYPKLYNE